MSRRINVNEAAQTDVEDAYEYLVSENAAAAVRFSHAVQDCFRSLADNPFLGREWNVRRPKLWGLRCIGVPGFRNYLAFYTVDTQTVTVTRVLHAARDIHTILERET